MKSLTPLFTERDIDDWSDIFVKEEEEKLVELLIQGGEVFVTDARDNGVYDNHTSNLRSSIGYVVADCGDAVFENFEIQEGGTDGKQGFEKAKKLAYELVAKYSKALALICVAGENYAVHVQNIEGKDVMYSSCKKLDKYIRDVIKSVKKNKGL